MYNQAASLEFRGMHHPMLFRALIAQADMTAHAFGSVSIGRAVAMLI
jgi:hypothetical protein